MCVFVCWRRLSQVAADATDDDGFVQNVYFFVKLYKTYKIKI